MRIVKLSTVAAGLLMYVGTVLAGDEDKTGGPESFRSFAQSPVAAPLEKAMSSAFKSLSNSKPRKEKGYWVYEGQSLKLGPKLKEKVYFYTKSNADGKRQGIMLIDGNVVPQSDKGVWKLLKGTKLSNPIVMLVENGAEEEGVEAASLPDSLATVVNKFYKGTLDLQAGDYIKAEVELGGIWSDAAKYMQLPTENLVVTLGKSASDTDDGSQNDEEDEEDPTRSVEIIHTGVWQTPLGIQGLTSIDTTFYLDDGPVIGIWSQGKFNKDKVLFTYKGPIKSKKPKDYKEAHLAVGAEVMTLTKYMRLMSAINTAQANLFSQGGTGRAMDASFNQLEKLPLDFIKVHNKLLKGYTYKSGDEPPPTKYYNLTVLGPEAKMANGQEGPYAEIKGQPVTLLGENIADFIFTAGEKGAKGNGRIDLGIDLGVAGKLGGKGSLVLQADEQSQFMRLSGNVKAGKLSGKSVALNLAKTKIDFYSPPDCLLPVEIKGGTEVKSPDSLALNSIRISPLVIPAGPGMLLECADGIYALLKNGVVVMFNGTKKLVEFAAKYLPAELDKVPLSKGLKYANGKVVEASEEVAKLVHKVPGVSKSVGMAGDAAKAAAEKADAAAKASVQYSFAAVGGAKAAFTGAFKFASDVGGAMKCAMSGGCSIPSIPWIEPHVFTDDIVDLSIGHANVLYYARRNGTVKRRAMIRDRDGRYRKFQSGGEHKVVGNAKIFRIDAVNGEGRFTSGVVALDRRGRIYVATHWKKPLTPANGHVRAIDIAADGTYIWIVRAEKRSDGGGVYRARLDEMPNLRWKGVGKGRGYRIDATRDGKAWLLANDDKSPIGQWRVLEPLSWDSWKPHNAWGREITVSSDQKPKAFLAQMFSPLGGPIFHWQGHWQQYHGIVTVMAAGRNGAMVSVNGDGKFYVGLNSAAPVR